MTVLYVDGGCSGNSQRDLSKRQMISVVTDASGLVLSDRTTARGSNNIAELIAVRDALQWCVRQGIHAVEIRTDSQNNLAWVNGTTVGKKINDRLQVLTLKDDIARLRQGLTLNLEWVPRDDNVAGHYIESIYGL